MSIKLIDILVPEIKYFSIIVLDKEIEIEKYNSIEIDFSPRIIFKYGSQQVLSDPVVSYRVEMKKENKRILYNLFKEKIDKDKDNDVIICTRYTSLILTKNNYKISAEIMAVPSFLERDYLPTGLAHSVFKDIHIKIDLKNAGLSLFENRETKYEDKKTENYKNRFEMLEKEYKETNKEHNKLREEANKEHNKLRKEYKKIMEENKILRNKYNKFEIMDI